VSTSNKSVGSSVRKQSKCVAEAIVFSRLWCPDAGELLNLDGAEAGVRDTHLKNIHGACDWESKVLAPGDQVVE